MQNDFSVISNYRYLFTLLSQSNADLAKPLEEKLPQHERVAAQLIVSNKMLEFTTCVTSVDGKNYFFSLDKSSRIFQSKGNWIWVACLEIYADKNLILSLPIQSRVIDIPYSQHAVCAHWLFRNIKRELMDHFNLYL